MGYCWISWHFGGMAAAELLDNMRQRGSRRSSEMAGYCKIRSSEVCLQGT